MLMKLFKIYTDKDEVLHKKAEEVSFPIDEETSKTMLDMVEYLRLSQDDEFAAKHNIRSGVGLAAPQIGISKRFYAVYLDDKDKHYEYVLVNPKIISTSVKKAYLSTGEGCLSVPSDIPGFVYRYYKVTIKAYDAITNKEVTLRLSGYPAIVFQHEYDHLDGVLYYERIDKNNPFKKDDNAIEI